MLTDEEADVRVIDAWLTSTHTEGRISTSRVLTYAFKVWGGDKAEEPRIAAAMEALGFMGGKDEFGPWWEKPHTAFDISKVSEWDEGRPTSAPISARHVAVAVLGLEPGEQSDARAVYALNCLRFAPLGPGAGGMWMSGRHPDHPCHRTL